MLSVKFVCSSVWSVGWLVYRLCDLSSDWPIALCDLSADWPVCCRMNWSTSVACITCALPMWTISPLKDSTEFPLHTHTHAHMHAHWFNGRSVDEPVLVCPLDPDGAYVDIYYSWRQHHWLDVSLYVQTDFWRTGRQLFDISISDFRHQFIVSWFLEWQTWTNAPCGLRGRK